MEKNICLNDFMNRYSQLMQEIDNALSTEYHSHELVISVGKPSNIGGEFNIPGIYFISLDPSANLDEFLKVYKESKVKYRPKIKGLDDSVSSPNSKALIYIGKSENLSKRLSQHFAKAPNTTYALRLYEAIFKKYNFKVKLFMFPNVRPMILNLLESYYHINEKPLIGRAPEDYFLNAQKECIDELSLSGKS